MFVAAIARLRTLQADPSAVRTEAFIYLRLGTVYAYMAQFALARDAYTEALTRYQKLHLPSNAEETLTLSSLAVTDDIMGDAAEARDLLKQALARWRELHDRAQEAHTLLFLGAWYGRIGDRVQARELDAQALRVFHELGDQFGEAQALRSIAEDDQGFGEYKEASDLYMRALTIFVQLNDIPFEAHTLSDIGGFFLAVKQYRLALEPLMTVLKIYQKISPEGTAGTLTSIGEVYLGLGQYADALQAYTQASVMDKKLGRPEQQWQALYGVGRTFERLRRDGEAEQSYRAAITVLERLRSGLERPQERVGFFLDKAAVYAGLTALLIRSANADSARNAAEAFETAEKSRARGQLDLLAEARARAMTGVDPTLLSRETSVQGELTEVDGRWHEEVTKPEAQRDRVRLEFLNARRLELENQLYGVRQRVVSRFPRYAELVQPSIADAETVSQILHRGEALLEYLIGDEVSVVWVVRPGQPLLIRLLPATGKEMKDLAAQFRVQLALPRAVLVPGAASAPAHGGFDLAVAHRLYQALVQPVQGDLAGVKTVFIVPDGPLLTLPLEVLVEGVTDASGKAVTLAGPRPMNETLTPHYFGDTYTLTYVQSASLLALLRRQQPAWPQGVPKPFVAFADPVYNADELGGQRLVINRGAAELEAALRSPMTGLGEIKLTRLPFTGEEAKGIGALFGATDPDSPSLYLRERATKTTVKELSDGGELATYRYVHFATHGLLGNEVAGASLEPALVLSLVDPKDNGFLRMSEVLNLRLHADMVVLSACETGLGEQVRGEGLIGLTRAFMYAGTPTVVVSLWNISDPATAALMVKFYRGLKDGLSKGEALR